MWFPPLIETLIAASIVYMAIENITGAHLQRRWVVTFAFGLVHGFGFSFALRESLQFAGSHLLTSLLAFNVGVELGQLLVLVVICRRSAAVHAVVDERVGHHHPVGVRRPHRVALADRAVGGARAVSGCMAGRSTWRFVATLLRWAMLLVLAVLAAWLVRPLVGAAPRRAETGRAEL